MQKLVLSKFTINVYMGGAHVEVGCMEHTSKFCHNFDFGFIKTDSSHGWWSFEIMHLRKTGIQSTWHLIQMEIMQKVIISPNIPNTTKKEGDAIWVPWLKWELNWHHIEKKMSAHFYFLFFVKWNLLRKISS